MKTRNLIIAACAVSALAVSCEKTNGDDPAGPDGKPKILATIDMSPKASNGYLVPIYDLDADGASMDEAYEVRTSNYVITYNDWAFVVEGTSGGNIRKFTVNQDGTLSEAGQLTVDGTGFGAAHLLVISETKAYASAMMENKIVIFNPSTMTKTGEIDLMKDGSTEFVATDKGAKTPNPLGMFLRDGKVYVGLGQFIQMPTTVQGAYLLVVDEKTDTPEKMISDDRLTSATAIGEGGMFIDENNDLYIPCWGSYGFDPAHHSGLLRIKSGEDVFDKDYCFDMSEMTFDGVEGGKFQYVLTYHYAGDGEIYFFGYCPAFASQSANTFYEDHTNYAMKGDLYGRTAEALPLPRTNAISCAINHIGDEVLFGLTTESNGVGIFSYDRRTGECSGAPIVNMQGTMLKMQVL